ncbi:MAG: acetyl-CoA C-acyltransferase [Chlorobi bacterium]|nr:acetyl-CoA C-acyltransferase [Chlorobiota bacterium]
MAEEVYILGVARTPFGSFGGSLASLKATKLGAVAIKEALNRANVQPNEPNEVFMGNVLTAGVGQAPARQAALFAGIDKSVPATTVNKVCASGMKSVIIGAQSIKAGDNRIVVAGGMESMSNVPYYNKAVRWGSKMGNVELIDGLIYDGLWDVYSDQHMGSCAEVCALEMNIPREEQDEYARLSYERAAKAWQEGYMKWEVTPVEIETRKGTIVVEEDEEYKRVDFEKMKKLRPVFKKEGTITAANASTINDGAAALVVAGKSYVEEKGLKPIARIVSWADAAEDPVWFTIAPTDAATKALKKAGLSKEDIDYWEINEAFSVVVLANVKKLGLDLNKVNVFGGAVSIGHPIGASGARIIITLLNVLRIKGGRFGLASICNGGGGASAIIVEWLGN